MINKSCPEKPSGQDLFYLLSRRIQHIFDEKIVKYKVVEILNDMYPKLTVEALKACGLNGL